MIRQLLSSILGAKRKTRSRLGLPNTLTGTFELRVDRLVGTVTDGFGLTVDTIQIDIRRSGELLASFPAAPMDEHGRFSFSYDIGGQFSGADLVREVISLTAYDSDGNSGRIWLDGAAQLELIRDHLGFPAVTVIDLDFSRGGNAKPHLGRGWSEAETDFTWTEGDDSLIFFDTPVEPGQYALRLTAGTILDRPQLSSQQLSIFINEAFVAQIFFRDVFVQFHECRFPFEVFGSAARSSLRLHHPDAVRPSDISPSGDTRRLCFHFKRLSVARLLPINID